MVHDKIYVANNGRLVIPSDIRQDLGIAAGGTLLLEYKNKEIRLRPLDVALDELRQVLKKKKVKRSLSAELIQERRREAKRG